MNYVYKSFRNPGPKEPSDMRIWADTLRRMFMALTAVGFSQEQALTIIGQVVGGGQQ